MGKSDILVLPPLVYGKLAGVVEFTVDIIEIAGITNLSNKNLNFLVQILWWGETNPFFVRPKKVQFHTKDKPTVINNDGYLVTYEIRTNLKLFKSYLEKCDVLELVVIDCAKNDIVGCAFLRDLTNLVFRSQFFKSSIIDYVGNPIGEITCHFVFREKTSLSVDKQVLVSDVDSSQVDNWKQDSLKINLNLLELDTDRPEKSDNKEQSPSLINSGGQWIQLPSNTQRSFTVHYNSPVIQNPRLPIDKSAEDKGKNFIDEVTLNQQITSDKFDRPAGFSENVLGDYESSILLTENCEANQKEIGKNSKKDIKLTKTKRKFMGSQIVRKTGSPNKTKMLNEKKSTRTNRTSILGKKSYADGSSEDNLTRFSKPTGSLLKTIVKRNGRPKTFAKVSREVSKLNKALLNSSKLDNHSDLEHVPVKDNCGHKSEDPEKSKDVSDTFELAVSAKSDLIDRKPDVTGCEKINVENKLFFNLSNPIERLYYETFFLKASGEFEIVEMLNQPDKKHVAGGNVQDDEGFNPEAESNNNNMTESQTSSTEASIPTVDLQPTVGCHRCKYYSKLNELGEIIESLKRFESKLRDDQTNDRNLDLVARSAVEPTDSIKKSGNRDDVTSDSVHESDFSREDSDFVEFIHYLSTR